MCRLCPGTSFSKPPNRERDESTSRPLILTEHSRASIFGQLNKGAFINPNKVLWEKGDFTNCTFMPESGETVVESLGVKPPLRALDLGCGDGTMEAAFRVLVNYCVTGEERGA